MVILKEVESKNADFLKDFRERVAGIRSGRPTARLVENISVDYLGQKLVVKQLGSISVSLPREIQITVWDEGVASLLLKAIESALNLQPIREKNLIRVILPPLSEERRAELIKLAKREAEEIRIKIRSFRDEVLKSIKSQTEKGELTEDDKFELKEKIQKIIDITNQEIERAVEGKIKEISE